MVGLPSHPPSSKTTEGQIVKLRRVNEWIVCGGVGLVLIY